MYSKFLLSDRIAAALNLYLSGPLWPRLKESYDLPEREDFFVSEDLEVQQRSCALSAQEALQIKRAIIFLTLLRSEGKKSLTIDLEKCRKALAHRASNPHSSYPMTQYDLEHRLALGQELLSTLWTELPDPDRFLPLLQYQGTLNKKLSTRLYTKSVLYLSGPGVWLVTLKKRVAKECQSMLSLPEETRKYWRISRLLAHGFAADPGLHSVFQSPMAPGGPNASLVFSTHSDFSWVPGREQIFTQQSQKLHVYAHAIQRTYKAYKNSDVDYQTTSPNPASTQKLESLIGRKRKL